VIEGLRAEGAERTAADVARARPADS